MASPLSVDVEQLLQPISEDLPTGAPPDKSDPESAYYQVKTARDVASQAEEVLYRAIVLGDETADLEPANWHSVVKPASDMLASQSKDLRVACWLTEALLRTHGFAGLRDGLAVCRGLCERYWDNIHPAPDPEEGHGDAVAMFRGLTGEAARRVISQIPLTAELNGRRFNLAHYRSSAEPGSATDGELVTLTMLEEAAAAAGRAFYHDLREDLQQAADTLAVLAEFLDERCLPDRYGQPTSPALSGLAEELAEAGRVVNMLARYVEGGTPGLEMAADGAGAPAGASTGGPIGAPRDRNDALRALQAVAAFFEHTEPHSPIPFALRQVIRWGKMSLPELLADLIQDRSVRDELQRRVGVPFAEE